MDERMTLEREAKDAYEAWCKPRMGNFEPDHPFDAFVAGYKAAHLAQPAQAVDVVAWRWRDDARPSLPWHTTNDAEVIQQMEATGGYEIEPLTRAISDAQAEGFAGFQIVENADVPDGEIWIYDKSKIPTQATPNAHE